MSSAMLTFMLSGTSHGLTTVAILFCCCSIHVLASGNTDWINPSNPISSGDSISAATTLDTVTARWTSTYQSAYLNLFCGPELNINRKIIKVLSPLHTDRVAKAIYNSMGTHSPIQRQRGLRYRCTRFRWSFSTVELLLPARIAKRDRRLQRKA